MISDRKKRILFIVPSLDRAGAETQVVNLANGLNGQVFEKHLLCFEKKMDLKENINIDTVNFYHIQRARKYDIALAKKIGALIDERKIDLVHCSLQIALFMGWLGVRFSRRKPLLTLALHTTVNRNLKAEIFDWILYQWLMRGCKKIICVCENQKRHWVKKFPFLERRTQVIYNGVDTDYFSPAQVSDQADLLRTSLDIPKNAKIICHIAGFRPEKGHALLLDVFKKVVDSFDSVYLICAGDGPLRPQITALAVQKEISDNIRFLGSIEDVRPLLAISDLSAISSTAVETFSIAMLEAMSMEVPLIATDIGGTGEAVIPGKTGYLAPVNNAQALTQCLFEALEDDMQRKSFGLQSRQFVTEKFSSKAMIEQTENLMLEVIGKQYV